MTKHLGADGISYDEGLRSVTCAVVVAQHLLAKIILQVAPDSVDMIGVVLRIVILGDETVALDTVVVTLARVGGSCPDKTGFGQICVPDPAHLRFCHRLGHARDVDVDECLERLPLRSGHVLPH